MKINKNYEAFNEIEQYIKSNSLNQIVNNIDMYEESTLYKDRKRSLRFNQIISMIMIVIALLLLIIISLIMGG